MAKQGKKKRSNWILWLALIAVAVIILLVVLFIGDRDSEPVFVDTVQKRTVTASVSESGIVEPVLEVKIAADVSGEVVSLEKEEGDEVKRGDVLVTIRPDNYQSALEAAQASLNSAIASELNARSTLEQARINLLQDSASFVRQNRLYRDSVISKSEWEQSKLKLEISRSQFKGSKASLKSSQFQVESQKASLKTAQIDLNKTTIFATMDGIITRQNTKLGERVVGTAQMEGTEVFRIADLSKMQVKVKINENDIIHVRLGDSAHIEVDAYEGHRFSGKVSEIAYSASQADMGGDQITSFEVKVEIDPASYVNDPELMRGKGASQSPFRPGMSAQVEIFTERVADAITAPIQAVTIRKLNENDDADPVEVVFVVDEKRQAAMREVKTGISDDRFIVIKEGLKEGETIVTGPFKMLSKDLKNGDKLNRLINESEEKAATVSAEE